MIIITAEFCFGVITIEENLHKDHRKRVKQDFLRNGFDHKTPSHKILEMLLFYCISRKDTNDLAHELINRYGSLSGVLDAPVKELITFNGLTESNVGLLKMIMPIARVYQYEKITKKTMDQSTIFISLDIVILN